MKPKQWNNGNIEVIHPQPAAMTEKLVLDEVLINGRRYRVPERIIMLDFWSKIGKDQHKNHECVTFFGWKTIIHATIYSRDTPSEISSPLTSLSSLDEVDENSRPLSEDFISREELHAAQVGCPFPISCPSLIISYPSYYLTCIIPSYEQLCPLVSDLEYSNRTLIGSGGKPWLIRAHKRILHRSRSWSYHYQGQ